MRPRPFRLLPIVCLLPLVLAAPAGAATFNVTSTADLGDADTGTPACVSSNGQCTLRAAVDQANALGSDDEIVLGPGTFDLGGTPGEDSNAGGDLDIEIDGSLTVRGAGARATIVRSNGADRVFEIFSGSDGPTVTIQSLAVTGGGDVTQGGGIFAGHTTTLTGLAIFDNQADSQGGTFGGQGGGVFSNDPLTLSDSTLSGNRALATGAGFPGQGGGLFVNATPATVTNVTVSGNTTDTGTSFPGQGGGIFVNDETTLAGVTVTGNQADQGGAGEGGGIFYNDVMTARGVIVSGNFVGTTPSECFDNDTLVSQGGNLERGSDCGFTGAGDQSGTDPLLGALTDNGGPTDTHALGAGSPAIDRGPAAGCPATDQRGVSRPQGPACDAGAFEVAVPTAPVPPVPPADDPEAGCLNLTGRLRGKRLGPAKLGRTKAAQRARFRGATLRSRAGLDRYCARGGGSFRIGYTNRRLLRAAPEQLRARIKNRVVLALTSSRRYALKGIRAGDAVAKARRRLKDEVRVRVGRNVWYVVRGRAVDWLVTTQRGTVRGIGIGDGRLTDGAKALKRFLRAWELS